MNKILIKSIESNETKNIPQGDFYWATGVWSACSSTCGNGIQKRLVQCYGHSKPLKDEYCRHLPKKEAAQRSCRLKTCTYWAVGPWKDCQATCGEKIVQKRPISCETLDEEKQTSELLECNQENKPKNERNCGLKPCEVPEPRMNKPHKALNKFGIWITEKWSKVFLKIFDNTY